MVSKAESENIQIILADIFINQRIECYVNNTINLRPLTPHITYHVISTK